MPSTRLQIVAQVLTVALLHWMAALPPHWVHHLPLGQSAVSQHQHAHADSHHESHQQQVERDAECVLLQQAQLAGLSLLPQALTLLPPDAPLGSIRLPQAAFPSSPFSPSSPSRGPPV